MTLTLETMRADIAAIIHEDAATIGDDDNLLDLGVDSMRLMNLALQWSEAGAPIDFADLAETATLAEWWAIVAARQAAAGQP